MWAERSEELQPVTTVCNSLATEHFPHLFQFALVPGGMGTDRLLRFCQVTKTKCEK